jgi:hypothetical protein
MENQNDINLQDLYDALGRINGHVKAIKGWVTFLGILALIGLIFGLLSGCGALLRL